MTVKFTTKMPFGKHKGKRLCDCPTNYLEWLSKQTDSDCCEYAMIAREILKEGAAEASAEEQADAFLRKHGVTDPNLFKVR